MSEVSGITSDFIDAFWPIVSPMLLPAIKRARGTMTVETVYQDLKNRDSQLWVAVNDTEIEAVAVTRIIQYPGIKVMAMPLVGGKNRNNWLHTEGMFVDFALSHDCQAIEAYMRPGWIGMVRRLSKSVLGEEWEPIWTVVRRKIK